MSVSLISPLPPARRHRLAEHLHECGPRPVFEALMAVSLGADLDKVLTDFSRLSPEIYQAMGADTFRPVREVR